MFEASHVMSASTAAAMGQGHHRSISDGSGPSRPPSSPPAPTPAPLAEVYAKKPLPPIPRTQNMLKDVPMPAPLNVKKHRSKEIYAPASSSLAQSLAQSLSLAPSLPTSLPGRSLSSVEPVNFSPPPSPPASTIPPYPVTASGFKASRISTGSTGNRRKSSRKILQLIGQDVDVMGGAPALPWHSDKIVDPFKKKPFRHSGSSCKSNSSSHSSGSTSSRIFSAIGHDLYMVGPKGERDSVPGLELDLDGISSRNSSCSPVTPHAISLGPRSHYQSLHHCACEGTPFCSCPVHEEDLLVDPCRCERLNSQFADVEESTDEYHQFATELAALNEKIEPSFAVYESPESRVRRMSAFVNFPSNAPTGRRRNMSTCLEPSPALHPSPSKMGMRSVSARISATTAPLSEEPEHVPEVEGERLHSVFDVDSDDEQERKSRSRWRRDRGKSETGRPQAWSRTGDQMRDLLSSAKDKARGLPNATKGDRRR